MYTCTHLNLTFHVLGKNSTWTRQQRGLCVQKGPSWIACYRTLWSLRVWGVFLFPKLGWDSCDVWGGGSGHRTGRAGRIPAHSMGNLLTWVLLGHPSIDTLKGAELCPAGKNVAGLRATGDQLSCRDRSAVCESASQQLWSWILSSL